MTTRTLKGYIARTTDKAVAFLDGTVTTDAKPLWLPSKKIVATVELDELSIDIQLKGEEIHRQAMPVQLEVDAEFLKRVGL